MKKRMVWMFALALCLTLGACKPAPQPTGPVETPTPTQPPVFMFSVMVEGSEEYSEFNQGHYMDMAEQEVVLDVVGTGAQARQYAVRGVPLRDVLGVLGAYEYRSLTVAALDGSELVLDPQDVDLDTTFFAVAVDDDQTLCPLVIAASKGEEGIIANAQMFIIDIDIEQGDE